MRKSIKRACSVDIMQMRRAALNIAAVGMCVALVAIGAAAGATASKRGALMDQETRAGSLYRSAHLEAPR